MKKTSVKLCYTEQDHSKLANNVFWFDVTGENKDKVRRAIHNYIVDSFDVIRNKAADNNEKIFKKMKVKRDKIKKLVKFTGLMGFVARFLDPTYDEDATEKVAKYRDEIRQLQRLVMPYDVEQNSYKYSKRMYQFTEEWLINNGWSAVSAKSNEINITKKYEYIHTEILKSKPKKNGSSKKSSKKGIKGSSK